MSTRHVMEIRAGRSFWVYGPNIGGGGPDIEIDSNYDLRISRDGRNWEPVDMSFAPPSFVQVVGDAVFIANETAYDGTGTYWIGTIR